MRRIKKDTLEKCAQRMTATLARMPQKAGSRQYVRSLGSRLPIRVKPTDYTLPAALVPMFQPYVPATTRADRLRPAAQPKSQESLMVRIAAAQGGRCSLCDGHLDFAASLSSCDPQRPSFDHVTPRSKGGKNVGNRLVAHRVCNQGKSNAMPTARELTLLSAVNRRLAGFDD